MNIDTFHTLIEQLQGCWEHSPISLEKQVLLLSNMSQAKCLYNLLQTICEYSVSEIVRYLAGVICEKLLAKYINWLNSNQKVHRIT